MSDSLWPHESQHARPPCLSPTPRVYSNPCPSSRWCHPAILSSVVPFSSCPQSLPASGSFPMREKNMDCYSLNVFIPPKFLCWTLDVLCDGGTFAWCLGGDGGACRNGTSAFIKKTIAHSAMWGHLEKAPAISRKEGLNQTRPCWYLPLGLPASRIVRNKCLVYMCHPVCDTLPLQPKWTKIWVHESKSHETDLGPSMKECPNNMSLWVLNEPAWCTAKFPISGSIPAKTT